MNADPYSGIIELLKSKQDEPSCKMEIGIVRSASPLIISAAGLENGQDDIVMVQSGSEAPEIAAGDAVLLLTVDYQKFYLMGRLI
jgi:hypothetical protein